MESKILLPLYIFIFLLASISTVVADDHQNRIQNYVIFVRDTSDVDISNSENAKTWHISLLSTIIKDSVNSRFIYSYNKIANGFAARLTKEEVEKMSQKPWFARAVLANRPYKLMTTYTPEFLHLSGPKGIWKSTKNMGEGIIIGVIDSGISPGHPSFDDKDMPPPPAKWKGHCDFNRTVCNNKLIGAKSFLNAGAEEQRHVSPFDTIDHGTHTASIAAGAFVDTTSMLGNAMGLASGMAPRAHIAVYRVCTLDGGLAAVPALIITIGSLLLPDTPNSLIECGQAEKARDVLTKIRGITNIQDEYNDLIAASEESKLIKSPWKDMLEKKCRPPLVITILIPFFQQLTGINVIMFYAPVLFKTIGFGDSGALMSAVITGLINSLATIVSIIVVDKGGRRLLFLQGGAQMLISQLIVGGLVAYGFGTSGVGTLSKTMSTLIVVFICTYVAAFAWSWGPLGWLVPSEIFPLEIRSAGQSINVSVNMFFTFVIGQIFLTMLCHMKFGLFFFFAGWVVIMTLFIYFFLPETKNVPIEEMILVWRNHWFWSKYIGDEDIHVGTGNTAMNGRHMTAP